MFKDSRGQGFRESSEKSTNKTKREGDILGKQEVIYTDYLRLEPSNPRILEPYSSTVCE